MSGAKTHTHTHDLIKLYQSGKERTAVFIFSFNITQVCLSHAHTLIDTKAKYSTTTPPISLAFLYTDKTSVHTVKHKPTSTNEPSHRLAISLVMPRANRWGTFSAHLRWYLSGYCGPKSVLWVSLSVYIRVAKV